MPCADALALARRSVRRLTPGALLGAALAGCGASDGPASHGAAGSGGAGGGGSLDVSVGLYTEVGVPLEPLVDGEVLLLQEAIQGGFVAYVAPEVRGLTTPEVEVRARVRDPDTDELLIDEERTPSLVPVGGDASLLASDVNQFREINHLVLCPQNGEVIVVDRDLVLELTVTERGVDSPRSGVATRRVRFTCPDGTALPPPLRCSCLCAPASLHDAACAG